VPASKRSARLQSAPTRTAKDVATPLATRAPFDLEATVRVLQRRPSNPIDLWERPHYLRVLTIAGERVLVEVGNRGSIDAPDVRFRIRSGKAGAHARARIATLLRRVLGLDVDPEPFARRAEAVPALRPVARALRGMRPPRFADVFEAFANVVPFQQLSLDAGVAIVARIVDRFGEVLEHDARAFRAFPTARSVADAPVGTLRACGLSTRKAESLARLARAIASGDLDGEAIACMPSADALVALRALPGIGAWSAALVLLRGFGRLDVFPPGDVGANRGLARLMRVDPGPALDGAIERFGPVRGHLYFCALGADLIERKLIRGAR
jgi:DNA-3-methyladenine glycosylase II